MAAPSHVSEAPPRARDARPPALEATPEKTKTKQNAHRLQKLPDWPCTVHGRSRPACPLHLQPGPGTGRLRGPSPRPPPPRPAETAPQRGRRGPALPPRRSGREGAVEAVSAGRGSAPPSEPVSPFTGKLFGRSDIHFLAHFLYLVPRRAPFRVPRELLTGARAHLLPSPTGPGRGHRDHRFSPALLGTRCPPVPHLQAEQTCNSCALG